MMSPLYTLRAIAQNLGLPESTVRYYRDAFATHLPVTGRGRRRRYPADAVPLFRAIADGFAEGRTRDEIAAALGGMLDDAAAEDGYRAQALVPAAPVRGRGDEGVLALVLDGERERREVMWQLAREIVRLGEAIERQHAILGGLADYLEHRAARASSPPAAADDSHPTEPPARDPLRDELDQLRQQLERERELVERLRRSKLDLERRAAEAEEALAQRPSRFRR